MRHITFARALPLLLALMVLPTLARAEDAPKSVFEDGAALEVGARLRSFYGSDPEVALMTQGLLRLHMQDPGEGVGFQLGLGLGLGGTPDGFAWELTMWQGFGSVPDTSKHQDIGLGVGMIIGVSGRQVTFPRLDEGIITEHGWGVELGLGVEMNIMGRIVVRPDVTYSATVQSSTTPCKDQPGKCEPLVDLPRGVAASLSAGWLF